MSPSEGMEEETFVLPKSLYNYENPEIRLNSSLKRRIEDGKNLFNRTPAFNTTVLDDENIHAVRRPPPEVLVTSNTARNLDRESDFCESEGALHMIYWQDCIAQISLEIQGKIESAGPCDFDFMKAKIIQYLFTVCIRLRLPNEIRFTAALIFNTYMLRQILSLQVFLENQKDLSPTQKLKEWETIETNAERQIPLRILSAIQISSKYHSYHDSLSCRQVANCLRSLGFPYTVDAVKSSEVRVFKIIEEKVPESPLTVCEMAMKVLTYTMKKREWVGIEVYDSIWQHVLVVLDVCFIQHKLVYEKFMNRSPRRENKAPESPNVVLSKFKWDFLLLTSAVIQTAVLCVVGKSDMVMVAEIVNSLLSCDVENAEYLRQAIVELIQEES